MTEVVFCNSPLLTYVNYLVFDNLGNLYANNFDKTIIKIDQNGNATTLVDGSTILEDANFCGMFFLDGYLYVAGYNFNVYKVNTANYNDITLFITLPTGSTIGITYYNNFFYVTHAAYDDNYVDYGIAYKINKTGQSYQVFIPRQNRNGLNYITVDNTGTFYITSTSINILKYNSLGVNIGVFPLTIPDSLTILFNNGVLYVSSYSNQVATYTTDGILINNNFAQGAAAYLGGGIAFDANNKFYVSNNNVIMFIQEPVPCFIKGSKILTNNGYIPIEKLTKNDLVKTLLDGYKPIYFIGKKTLHHFSLEERIKDQLYQLNKDKYPELFEPLILTGGHAVLVDDFSSDEQRNRVVEFNGGTYITDNKYRLPACLDERSFVYEKQGSYTVYHIALENENYYYNYGIYANGLLVESCSKRYLIELSGMELIE